jgi:hypothetical protein
VAGDEVVAVKAAARVVAEVVVAGGVATDTLLAEPSASEKSMSTIRAPSRRWLDPRLRCKRHRRFS